MFLFLSTPGVLGLSASLFSNFSAQTSFEMLDLKGKRDAETQVTWIPDLSSHSIRPRLAEQVLLYGQGN